MVSEGVTTAILVIAGIVIAAMVVSTIISQYYLIDSSLRGASRNLADRVNTRIEIVHGAVEGNHFIVFVKNTGRRVIGVEEVKSSDVYFGKSCETLYKYSQDQSPQSWLYEELSPDSVWSIGETIVLRIYNSTSLGSPPYCIKLVLPNGVSGRGFVVD